MIFRYTRHALERLTERKIEPKVCEMVIQKGETLEKYPDDIPYPSELRLWFHNQRPIHVVFSIQDDICFVITAYEPSKEKWSKHFKERISNAKDN